MKYNNYKNITMYKIYRKLRFSVVAALSIFLLACQMELHSGLSEADVNDMLAIMLSNDISAKKIKSKKGNTYTLSVDESMVPEAVQLLREHGFPKESTASIKDMFKEEGLVSSPMEERVRYIYALSQSVQETLTNIDGVLIARVHIVMPENNPYIDKINPSSASVFIKYHPRSNLNDIKSEIKMIVEKSIEGLSYDKVSVVMLPAQLSR
ncbi:MAG: Type III secretion bridge between inner and outermembrane lipoprotein (YscJ,HrcJ,EscJ, PscJ) [uncultured Thiotrichaceae bacterium]|uniref:Lipoprotein n=1 Tax=uncultured Thiotrichaceae bacterium TaxID=298394 RepID=A0A6S6T9D7_9GAMM|nr:MAG: Type III secretion bridge between inner and outermembrane lipoprotein (YscJ,HrcJ,EscJ, PscJ) [uncultured Thiotrichaceae bacterium]